MIVEGGGCGCSTGEKGDDMEGALQMMSEVSAKRRKEKENNQGNLSPQLLLTSEGR